MPESHRVIDKWSLNPKIHENEVEICPQENRLNASRSLNGCDMLGHARTSMQEPTHEYYMPVTCKDMPT